MAEPTASWGNMELVSYSIEAAVCEAAQVAWMLSQDLLLSFLSGLTFHSVSFPHVYLA